MNHLKYLVIVEEDETSYGAYVPGLPGCIAAADTREELVKLIQEAIEFYIEGLKADNIPVPKPTSRVEFVEVAA